MYKYLEKSIVEKAVKENTTMGAYVKTLAQLGVAGVKEPSMINWIKRFLTECRAEFSLNDRGMFWVPTIEGTLAKTFSSK